MRHRFEGSRPEPAGYVLLLAGLVALAAACGDSTSPMGAGPDPDGPMTMPMDTATPALTDADIAVIAQYDTTWTWFEFSDSLLARAGNSPHATMIRARYNAKAATQLDSLGRVRVGADFPDSSTVVKEVYEGTTATSYLVMHKAEGDPHASHGSWLWGEYDAGTGAPLHSIAEDSGICHNCHVVGVDHMRMNDAH